MHPFGRLLLAQALADLAAHFVQSAGALGFVRFQFDDVPAEGGAHGRADLAGLQGERGRLEGGHHLPLGEPAKVAALRAAALVVGQLGGQRGKILALLDLGNDILGLGAGCGILFLARPFLGHEQDVAGAHALRHHEIRFGIVRVEGGNGRFGNLHAGGQAGRGQGDRVQTDALRVAPGIQILVVAFGDLLVGGGHLEHMVFQGKQHVFDGPALAPVVEQGAGLLVGDRSGCGNPVAQLLQQHVVADAVLEAAGRGLLPLEHGAVHFGVELAVAVAEGRYGLDGTAQFNRRHRKPDTHGLVGQQALGDHGLQHLSLEAHLLHVLGGDAGVAAAQRFHLALVGAPELLEQDGLLVHRGKGTRRAVVHGAHAPEDEHEDDDAEGNLHAPRLRVGTDLFKH
ncbi:hypothetical protein DSECCO2_652720 [anaerobic digester metagenome]